MAVPIGHSFLQNTSESFLKSHSSYIKHESHTQTNIKRGLCLFGIVWYPTLLYLLIANLKAIEPYFAKNNISTPVRLASDFQHWKKKERKKKDPLYDLSIGTNCIGSCICRKEAETQLQNQPGFSSFILFLREAETILINPPSLFWHT